MTLSMRIYYRHESHHESSVVDGGEPKSRHIGRFAAPLLRTMTEKPAIAANVYHCRAQKPPWRHNLITLHESRFILMNRNLLTNELYVATGLSLFVTYV